MPTKPDVPQIIAQREKRRRRQVRKPGTRLGRFATGFLAVFVFILGIGVIIGSYLYSTVVTDLPSIEILPLLLGPDGNLRHPTRIYDRSGEHLLVSFENANATQGEYVFLELIPQDVIDATLSTSDPDFWEHPGYDSQGETRTLAVRLVSELLLWEEEEGWRRTWRENLLAAQITDLYGRETILEWYLNHADYGYLAYGVDEAAWVYFGKPVEEVSLSEAAMLAAVSEAPMLNPIDTPLFAIERQRHVLLTMMVQGFLSGADAASANLAPIEIQPAPPSPVTLAPDFVDLVLTQLDTQIGESRVLRGGLEIISTLDLDLQNQVTCTAEIQTARLTGALSLDTLGGAECQGATLLPRLKSGDVSQQADIDAAVVVIDSSTGQILALSGEPTAPQQPGTILSPFIYLTAFTRGLSPASLVWDIPANLPPSLQGYGNLDGEFHGPMRIRTALANDYIVPALATLTQVGPNNVWRTAIQSGLHSLEIPSDEDTYRMILDRGASNLMEITHAYSMFSNQGILAGQIFAGEETVHATTLLTVRDQDGRTWLDWNEPSEQTIASAQLAYLITDILGDEFARRETLGHPNPLELGRPSASKIGQSFSGESVWTIGYSPQRVVGAWLGFPETDDGSSGETRQVSPLAAAGLWHAVMKTATTNLGTQSWQEPIGINRITVCDPSGLLPTEDCPTTVVEIFLPGSEPIQTDNLYRTYLINSQTGRLATVYTPPEFVEERVYMVVPPEASDWADEAGLDIPPSTYDVIFNPSTTDEFVSILSPEAFSYVSGEVAIGGRARGDDFAYYRLQIGEGLNPRQWLQIGEDITEPVDEGYLATWDTTGLNGLYAIQLLVVGQDQTVSSATIQVTVDNQPPSIQVTHPNEEQVFKYPQERTVTFQAQVADNLGIAWVEFLVNGDPISSLAEPPYAAPWTGSVGEHSLKVIATDLAGNQDEVVVNFSIER